MKRETRHQQCKLNQIMRTALLHLLLTLSVSKVGSFSVRGINSGASGAWRGLKNSYTMMMMTTTRVRSAGAGIVERIQACNRAPSSPLLPFAVESSAGERIVHGCVPEKVAEAVGGASEGLVVDDPGGVGEGKQKKVLLLKRGSLSDQNRALELACKQLKSAGMTKAWRDELVPACKSYAELLKQCEEGGNGGGAGLRNSEYRGLEIERGCAALFGIPSYGVHVNGYCETESGEIMLWVATRSLTKGVCPGMLDNFVAGGVNTEDLNLLNNVIRECEEEAGVPLEYSKNAIPTGLVSYSGLDDWCYESCQSKSTGSQNGDGGAGGGGGGGEGAGVPSGYKNEVLFTYDIKLPADFAPKAVDGEVQSFKLMTMEEVLETLETDASNPYNNWKANSAIVVADFLIRRGVLKPESCRELYYDIATSLRQGEAKLIWIEKLAK